MCCFSGPVRSVSSTAISARAAGGGRQYLAYRMTLSAASDVAMVLPLPLPDQPGDTAVAFIDLSGYPDLFDDIARAFPAPRAAAQKGEVPTAVVRQLEVVEVGAFEAPFVPGIADFSRLDERFRLPAGTWDRLPRYRDYGFAVLKLKAGARAIQPMAFSFPRRDQRALFFPTVHLHDGTVHQRAEFDHELYCQATAGEPLALADGHESTQPASATVDARQAKGQIAADGHLYHLPLHGTRANDDTWLRPPA